MQQAIRRKAGPAYLNWLRDVELQRLGMAPTAIEEYVLALSTYDEKRFRQFFQVSLFLASFVKRHGEFFRFLFLATRAVERLQKGTVADIGEQALVRGISR